MITWIALGLMGVSFIAFVVGWSLRGERARAAEAASAVRFEALQQLLSVSAEELRELKASHFQALAKQNEESSARAAAEAIARQVPELTSRTERAGELIAAQKARIASLETELTNERVRLQDERELLARASASLSDSFKALSAEALRSNNQSFLDLAKSTLERFQEGARSDLDARHKAVEALVTPLNASLESCREQVEQLERARSQAYGVLSSELRAVAETQHAVRSETSKLVLALRASPKTRGRWGEHTLRNVLELSGLSDHCDFSTEESFERGNQSLRPDAIIRLPGGRHLVVDAKTSMAAYLDAIEATDESERERLLVLHAAQLRSHLKELAAKAYWDGLTVTPDFVVMFVPGDNFYAAAVERDSTLFEDAAAHRVIIATPSTLIALAKAVAFGWRQEKVADNAKRVHELGRELYRRMIAMTEHLQNCGSAIGKSVKCFNQFVGSLEQSVMPQARRFNELEVEGTATEIPTLDHIDVEPRLLRSDRDFAPESASNQEPFVDRA